MKKINNILYIVHRYDYFTKDQIEILAKKFKTIYVLVRYNPIVIINKILKTKLLEKYQLDKIINKTNLPSNIKIFPTPIPYLPINFFYKILGYLHFLSANNVIKKNRIKFDLIHSHFTWTAGYVGAKLKQKYKKPLIITIHENPNWLNEETNNKNKQILWTWKNADILIRVNKNSLNKLKKINNKSIYISNGYNNKLFFIKNKNDAQKKLNLPINKKILLNIGNLEKIKGQEYLIKAVNKMISKNKNILCLIIGEGSQRKKLEDIIKFYKLENYVKLVGLIPHQEINTWLNTCDLFIFPSIKESFGIAQLEAMACGKPIVATHNEGSDEIITNPKIGFLISPKNSTSLSKAIVKSLNIKWDSEYIQNSAKNFQWNKICNQIYKQYQAIIN